MGASFRKVEQIVDLAGCDLLTISPDLLDALQKAPGEITPKLTLEARARLGRREDLARREDLPLDAQPGSDGRREIVRRHPQVLRRRPQARAVGGDRCCHRVRLELPADSPLRQFADRPTLVVLLRSFGCTFCREAMADVAAAKDAIREAGAEVAFVHGGTRVEAAPWFAKFGLGDVMTISDPGAGALPGVRSRPHHDRRAGRSQGVDARRGVRAVARLRRADAGDDAAAARRISRARRSRDRRATVTAARPIVPTTSRSFAPRTPRYNNLHVPHCAEAGAPPVLMEAS